MKKLHILGICLLLALGALRPSPAAIADELLITTTIYPLYLAAANIAEGVNGVRIQCLAPPEGGCLHDYQLTAKDRILLEQSDAVLINGAGLEGFLDRLLPQLPGVSIDTSAGIERLLGNHDEENPHIWVSVAGFRAQVQNTANGLAVLDPAHADAYRHNAAAYDERLSALEADLAARLSPLQGTPIVTFHEAFDYFAGAFGLRVVATVESESGSAPAARELATLAEIIRQEGVRALFVEPDTESLSVALLARETGAQIYMLDPIVSGDGRLDGYERLMTQNAETLLEALQ